MLLFIKVMFVFMVIGEVARILLLGIGKYPRQISRWSDAIALITNLPFLIWAACLIWG